VLAERSLAKLEMLTAELQSTGRPVLKSSGDA
jgi:hypothetical protein